MRGERARHVPAPGASLAAANAMDTPARPERWEVRLDGADVAVLDIPPDAQRDRRFEISCRFAVSLRADGAGRHGLRIDVDGSMEWSRTVDTENPEQSDSLDYRFRREVAAGMPLRVVAKTDVQGPVQRLELTIEAEEG